MSKQRIKDKRFTYTFDKRSKYITWSIITIIIVVFGLLMIFGRGNYMPAWFMSFVIAIGALYILSIPRYIRLKDNYLEVHCLVELTKIHIDDIKNIRPIDREELKPSMPILGSFGFFGYYGYYFHLREWDIFKIYATDWDSLIEVEDIYEERYIISCSDRDGLIESIYRHQQDYRAEFD